MPLRKEPGTLVYDNGGRTGRNNGIGDCTTRAIVITMREFNNRVNYKVVCNDIVKDKQKHYKNPTRRPLGCKDDNWLKTNDGAPRMTKRRLMRQYTGTAWVDINIKKPTGARYTFKELAVTLSSLKSVMLVSDDHIVSVREGVIYDAWDSKKCRATHVFCKKSEVGAVRRLLK